MRSASEHDLDAALKLVESLRYRFADALQRGNDLFSGRFIQLPESFGPADT